VYFGVQPSCDLAFSVANHHRRAAHMQPFQRGRHKRQSADDVRRRQHRCPGNPHRPGPREPRPRSSASTA